MTQYSKPRDWHTNAPVDIRGQLLGIGTHRICVLSVIFLVIQQEIKK